MIPEAIATERRKGKGEFMFPGYVPTHTSIHIEDDKLASTESRGQIY